MTPNAQRCLYFNEPLTWDRRRKYHGNHRLEACKRVELQAARG